MLDVRRVDIDKTKRTIVISDIHANLELFNKLLDKLNYTDDDYLFINGDLCEKGDNSLDVIEFVRNLSRKTRHVYVTKGNCDVLHRSVFNRSEWIIPYMNKRKKSVLNEMLSIKGRSLDDFSSIEELSQFYRQHFHNEIEWIESLPIAYETDDYIIIHAGIDRIEDWKKTEESMALSLPAFYEKEHYAEKMVIVGHWPVVNYRSDEICSHNPIIDFHKRIISIDGGNQIKDDGQLNALVIEKDTYTFIYVDELKEEKVVQRDYTDSLNRKGTVTYPNYEMKIIKKEPYFTLCENSNLGFQQWIKNEYLSYKEDQVYCKDDLSTTFLSVKLGEKVWIVDKECDGFVLVKNGDGEVGWIPFECLGS